MMMSYGRSPGGGFRTSGEITHDLPHARVTLTSSSSSFHHRLSLIWNSFPVDEREEENFHSFSIFTFDE